MKKQFVVKCVAMATVTLAASSALVAQAGSLNETVIQTSADGVRNATVPYSDLDLSTQAGQQTLHYRIDRAAKAVCGSTDLRVLGDLRRASENRECAREARDQALSQINAASLAAN